MAKRRKTKNTLMRKSKRSTKEYEKEKKTGFWGRLREETRNSIVGIFLIIISIVLLGASLASSGWIGSADNKPYVVYLYEIIHFLFGIGYYVIPLLFVVLGINFFRAGGHNFTTPALIAGPFFLISTLGLFSLADSGSGIAGLGGWIGYYIMTPMVGLFAPLLTGIIFAAILLVAVMILFDTPLHLGFMFSFFKLFKREKGTAQEEDEEEYEDDDVEEAEEESEEEDDAEEEDEEEPEPAVAVKPSLFTKVVERVIEKKSDGIPFRFNSNLHTEYTPPPLSLLAGDKGKPGSGNINANSNIIKRTLQNFGIPVEMDEISPGPSITRYALKPAEGVRLSKITALQHDLELSLAVAPIRIEAPIPGKSLVGIEIPNTSKSTVGLGSLLSDPTWSENPNPLFVPLGKGISGTAHFVNIARMPHILVAGATGAGKSVTIHTIITSLLYRNSPERLRFIMVDPKRVELTSYNGIPHLLTPVIIEPKKVILTLKWATTEMDRRYDVLLDEKCNNIKAYHENVLQPALEKYEREKAEGRYKDGEEPDLPELMPYMVIIIDELADLMQAYPRELEAAINRLAAKSRAVGIHLIIATQSPRVNVITGLIKSNIPARIALQVVSQIDSRTILDASGAENLLGAGDMLYLSAELPKPIRLQSAFISDTEVRSVVKFLKDHYEGTLGDELNLSNTENKNAFFGIPEEALSGSDGEDDDEKYNEAKELVMATGKASTSFLQRRLSLGYARAARMMDVLEERGVISAGNGAKPREVLMKDGDSPPKEE